MSIPPIAICIPTRNQAEFISDALRSAFEQTVPAGDVVVSDDAGTDGTAGVVERFRETLAPHLKSILRYDRSDELLGIGGNFDRAVRLGRGDLVVKLDSDDILEPNFVEVLSERLLGNPEAGWAHCNVLNVHPDGSPIGLAHTRKKSGYYPSNTALAGYLNHNDTCHCVLIRKSAYLAVGGYRLEMKTCEDWMLWLEMLLAGWGYAFDERVLARMRKYDARPELMSRRRMDFVASVKFMVPRIESLCRHKAGGMILPADLQLKKFRGAVSRLCVSSGCDEADRIVRRTLFAAACEIQPTVKNRLWFHAGRPLPARVTRLGMRLAGLPRRLLRAFWQRMKHAS